jgi:transposase
MQVMHEVCCGLDVHKKSVTACVRWASGRRRQTREFGTFTKDLLAWGDWLRSCGVTHVAVCADASRNDCKDWVSK